MAPPAGPATPTAGLGAPPAAAGAPPGWTPGGPGLHRGGPRPHGLVLAHAGSRFVARMVDTLIVAVMCVVANAWFAVQWWRAVEPSVSVGMKRIMAGQPTRAEDLPVPPTSANVLLFLIFFVAVLLWFLYEVPGSASTGQTLGKRLLGIKVVRLDSEERLGFARALRRWGRLGLPTLLWPCYGVGFLLQLLDCLFVVIDRPLRQALHDKAAATVVVQVGRPNPSDRVPPSESSHGGRDAHPR
ncbi:MAG TPA: RDD family protein, partial [Micromonosporaceae bacterium]